MSICEGKRGSRLFLQGDEGAGSLFFPFAPTYKKEKFFRSREKYEKEEGGE